MCGDNMAGFTIFWADDGLDTGPILLQESCPVLPNDTVDSLYNRFLYPAGIKAMTRAVDLVANGTAPKIPQTEIGATYDAMLNKIDLQKIDWTKSGQEIFNFIRGMDSVPGSVAYLYVVEDGEERSQVENHIDYSEVRFFGASLYDGPKLEGKEVIIKGMCGKAIVHEKGMLVFGSDGVAVNVQRIKIGGKMIPAQNLGEKSDLDVNIKLTTEEELIIENIQAVWASILNIDIDDNTDFFASGAGSMDVVRLIEEVKELIDIDQLENEIIFMSTQFKEFCIRVILIKRSGGSGSKIEIEYDPITMHVNKRDIKFPHQLFINGKFVNSESGKKTKVVNPADESIICEVECASVKDVDVAVQAAKKAYEEGEWSKISARERGELLMKLADLMEEHKEELATLESIDSGAVYTLALKTHVGMSINTWRYFAGWCDKIQGTQIPIANARPNKNLTFTKREPIG